MFKSLPRHSAALVLRGPAILLLLGMLLVLLGGCYESSTSFRDENTARLTGGDMLFLSPALLAPIRSVELDGLIGLIEAGMAKSPHVGKVITRTQLAAIKDMPLALQQDYALYSNMLSLVGISNPEISRRLGKAFNVRLLALVQLTYQACDICEAGNQLWMVSHVVEAETGKIVLRANYQTPLKKPDPDKIKQITQGLAVEYMREFELAFIPKWHRVRFYNLKKPA